MNDQAPQLHKADPDPQSVRKKCCPSCGEVALFRYVGRQRWPAQLVEQGRSAAFCHLWTCLHCGSTLADPCQNPNNRACAAVDGVCPVVQPDDPADGSTGT